MFHLHRQTIKFWFSFDEKPQKKIPKFSPSTMPCGHVVTGVSNLGWYRATPTHRSTPEFSTAPFRAPTTYSQIATFSGETEPGLILRRRHHVGCLSKESKNFNGLVPLARLVTYREPVGSHKAEDWDGGSEFRDRPRGIDSAWSWADFSENPSSIVNSIPQRLNDCINLDGEVIRNEHRSPENPLSYLLVVEVSGFYLSPTDIDDEILKMFFVAYHKFSGTQLTAPFGKVATAEVTRLFLPEIPSGIEAEEFRGKLKT